MKQNGRHNQSLGAHGESLAAEYLIAQGYKLLARNWRDGKNGELDLIFSFKQRAIAVEVKTRSGSGYGNPLEAITVRKSVRLRKLLQRWVSQQECGYQHLQIDAIGITIRTGQRPRIDHLQGIV